MRLERHRSNGLLYPLSSQSPPNIKNAGQHRHIHNLPPHKPNLPCKRQAVKGNIKLYQILNDYIVEGLLYYVSVAVLEELYVRGLLLRLIETLCAKRRFAQQAAVMLSAVLFGAGHLPGMMGQSGAVIVCRLLWTISLGVYLGALYLRSGSLWLPILVHMLIDFCATPFTFVKEPVYTLPMVASVAAGYFVIAAWEFYRCLLRKEPARTNKAPLP